MEDDKIKQIVEAEIKKGQWDKVLQIIYEFIENKDEQFRGWFRDERSENRLGVVISWYNFWVQIK